MDDDWREDGSLRGLNAGGDKGKARGKGKGPQFTRVIPKFLQKYHQPPAIQAKFATLPKADEEEDEGLDEVQQAAIDEYLVKKQKEETTAEGSELDGKEDDNNKKTKSKTSGQNVVEMGKNKTVDVTRKKKRKRTDRQILSNKKLLSFSMDDEFYIKIMRRHVNEHHVKQQIRHQQQIWETEQVVRGASALPPLQIWSIGKLLRVLETSKAAAKPLETLKSYGIIRYVVGSMDEHQVPSPPIAVQVPIGDIVTYTSNFVSLTGFLHFGDDVYNCDTLHLCDSNSKLPSYLLDPSVQVIDQLVLVKRWVLVDKTFGGEHTPTSMFLEIHDEKLVLVFPIDDLYTSWTQEDVFQVLESSYQTKDPPMYTGSEPWAASAARLQRGNVDNEVVQLMTENGDVAMVRKHRKRKRVHVVFGRVTSLSSISRQKDCESSHFFVEIESQRSCKESTTQSTVNVMFTGVYSMRWHLFLRPGKMVLLTDLVKVLSRECDMFLLQTTHECAPGRLLGADKGSLETLVLVWNEQESSQMNMSKWINNSLDFSKENVTRCSGKLLDYEGKVCRLLWDECIELQGQDETRVIVSLFHFPYEQELGRLRIGGIVRVYGAHVLRWPTPIGGKLVIGLCPRSYFAVTAYGDPSRSCLVKDTRPHRSRTHKKWSCLGDFHTQSMVLSMWILELLELLNAKYFFGEVEQVRLHSSILSFAGIRRRRAAAQVAKKLQLSLSDGSTRAAMTLGALFLKCHSASADNCITLQLPPREKMLTSKRAITIRELQAFSKSKLSEKTAARSGGVGRFDELQSMRISAQSLDWCLLLACIRGNVDTGDLEICDRTGSMPLRLCRAETGMSHIGERGMYLIQNFVLMVEDYNQMEEVEHEDRIPMEFCISCSVANVEFISIHEDDFASYSQEETTAPDAQESQELVFLVTHVDALPLSSIRSAGHLPEYRVVHGIVCPIGDGLQSGCFIKLMCTAEILVNTDRVSWYIQKGGCYRVQALQVSLNGVNRVCSQYSVEDLAAERSMDYLKSAMVVAENNNLLCFDSLEEHRCHIGGESITQERPFRVYRVEHGQMVPIRMACNSCERCGLHEICQQVDHDGTGVAVVPVNDDRRRGEATRTSNAKHHAKHAQIEVTVPEFMAMSIFRHFLQRSEVVAQVSSLLQHPLTSRIQQSGGDGKSVEEGLAVNTVEPNLHKPHLVSIVGIITKKKYYWRSNSQQQSFGSVVQTATSGVKRTRECDGTITGHPIRQLRAIVHVRDLQHLDTVEIRVDASRFVVLGTLQRGDVVEFSRLQGFIARSSYKAFLSWGHLTAARLVFDGVCLPARNAELFGSMQTTFLNDLYHATSIDRMLHRYVVSVMHISYVLLKRKCGLCHQSLQLDKHRGCWKHAEPQSESKYSRDCARRWVHMTPSDPSFRARTYMGTTVRCIIDDGSGQAELFSENDVAWELLMCTDGQRQRFANILSNYVDELKYFSGRTASESFATSKAERDQEYYQNELRAFVLDAIPSLRSIVVFAQQFYSAKQKESTSVLSFGKDFHITTKTVPLPKLEAKRVDRVHVRNELKRRLVQFHLSRS